ncbi:hypothetical protein D6825_00845 [Candidatus Woesearchaeota archaeon]|nr:MAG: hypothetical protein D6825_00845 [Candidatus Woesearchaeota archaeon]
MKKRDSKSKFVTIISMLLIVYGSLGLAATAYGSFHISKWGIPAILSGDGLNAEFQDMSRYMRDASISASNAAKSIRAAKITLYNAANSAEIASSATNSAGDALYKVAGFVGFEILGWKPMGETYSLFKKTGDQLKSTSASMQTLGVSIKGTGDSLEQNAKDMETMSSDFKELSEKMSEISQKLANTGTTTVLGKAYWIIATLSALHHAIMLLLGISLLKLNR